MNQKTEKEIVLYYLNNLLKTPISGDLEERVCGWFEENARDLIGQDVESQWETRRRHFRRKPDDEEPMLPRTIRTVKKMLEGQNGRIVMTPEISAIIDAFHLSPESHPILALRVHIANIQMLESLVDSHRSGTVTKIMAGMLGMSQKRYEKFYSQNSELVEKGLFETRRRCEWTPGTTEAFSEILLSNCRTKESVRRIVLGKKQKAALKPEHFEHVEEEYRWLKNLLQNSLSKRQRGVNVLIYGKPGTGKTELAKTLCNDIGASLYVVSCDWFEERNGTNRRSDLAASLSILQDDINSVLLMDEAEDVFAASSVSSSFLGMFLSKEPSSKSKLYFNRLLEHNAVPVIWISNSIRGVDPAHLRRFSYAMNMESPDEIVQARIWNHAARKNKVRLPKEKIEKLVQSYDIAPGIIDASLRTAALTGDEQAIEKTVESLQTAMLGRTFKKHSGNVTEHPFSTELLNCDLDLEKLTQRILSLKVDSFSLCLYGIPGSGKSAYARYLAEKLKMKVLHRRASDLLGPYVGLTERNIAEAFAEARRKKMLLVLDEADSFLQDRRHARQNWEVTQVNEMLTQMESHPLPFVCTTNLMDDLDQASLRRFTFKVKYDYLKQNQVSAAFKHFFGEESTVSLSGLKCLSPGDFAVVAKKARIYGFEDHAELVEQLRLEQQVKDTPGGTLGFTVS